MDAGDSASSAVRLGSPKTEPMDLCKPSNNNTLAMTHEILISAEGLARFYGAQRAIDQVSFNVHRGEILGLLGPNGAGKSTTMQIISGVLAPSAGAVTVAGLDMQAEARRAKRHIGFLPEQPPLYPDLSVDEYLRLAARLRNIAGDKIAAAVRLSKQRSGLEQAGRRLIQNLSRGYKQRVGIAQAIIHAPAAIILDEPTAGLDPIQIREIRALMRELGEDHSVILSTHILSEVQALCDRVLIIHQGHIALDQPLAELQADHKRPARIELGLGQPPAHETLAAIAGVKQVRATERGTFMLDIAPQDKVIDKLAQMAVEKDWGLYKLTPGEGSLESIFMRLTQGAPAADG